MGAWGAGILENDVAADVRLTFDERLAVDESVEDAIEAVMEEQADGLEDDDDRPAVILALALLVSERQPPPTWLTEEAREIIASELNLDRWEGTPEYEQRRAEEAALLAVLDGAAPHPGRTGRLLPGQQP